jgi:aryl-alcohol dehydrogenase-like predicted oxidoreductase
MVAMSRMVLNPFSSFAALMAVILAIQQANHPANNNSEKTFACMKAGYDAGINFFDCAEGYAGGESERVMGECIKKFGWKRNDIVISTKIYWGAANGDNPVNNGGLSRKHLVEGLNASLERLQLDYGKIPMTNRGILCTKECS